MEPANPYLPVDLPELGFSVGWAMCRNAMCPNFGVQYAGGPPNGKHSVSDDRYTINGEGRFSCKLCHQSFKLNSNSAIRRVARQFLKWSLPFADCPKSECANHGVNIFENNQTGARPSERPYLRQGSDRAKCRACGTRFNLGTPFRLHGARGRGGARKRTVIEKVIEKATDGVGRRRAVEGMKIGGGSYYAHLRSVGARLRDWLAWRNAGLLAPKYAKWKGPIRVYTDVMAASLWRWGDVERHAPLAIPVSVIDLPEDRTYYLLAAHPGFLPMTSDEVAAMPLEMHNRRKSGEPPHVSPYDCFDHRLRIDAKQSTKKQYAGMPSQSRHGQYLVESYLLLAHFLVVRKLLSRFPQVFHYMDGAKAQISAALTALADEVKAGRWEIALFQRHDRTAKPDSRRLSGRWIPEDLKASLDGAWSQLEERWSAKRAEKAGGLLPHDPALDPQLFREAFRGAFSKRGGWAWLEHPPPGASHSGGRSLWLTQRPNVSYGDVGRDLLWACSTLPVDRVHGHLRDRIVPLQRPRFRSSPGRSYRDSAKTPPALLAELWIGSLMQNFVLRTSGHPRKLRAGAMGLMRRNGRVPDLAELALKFRLNMDHAVRISNWLRD